MAASGVWLMKHSSDITQIVQKFHDLHGVAISIRDSDLGLDLFDSDTKQSEVEVCHESVETDEREQSDALELSLKSLTDTVT